ncbi:MAG: endonuclease/exonuclease/phosphatase family protein [Deltaproteobacteria bacterium]|nr:endonuclease/exonuclease/phosphatase family protein [Deltaproteobacteria bacterium]
MGSDLLKLAVTAVICLLVLPSVGCSSDCSSGGKAAPPIRFATYNTGLAYNFVGYAKERRQLLANAIADADADVLCLQEVWLDDDVTLITQTAKTAFPHSYSVKTSDQGVGGPAACTETDATALKGCVEANCSTVTDSLADCALSNCSKEYEAASPTCKTCLASNIGLNSIGDIFQACALGSASYAFGGRNGVVLLSKTPLEGTEMLEFESFLNKRVVLHATTHAPSSLGSGAPRTHVFCTHLTAGLGSVAYSGKFGGWEQEQAKQIDQLIAWAKQKAGGERAVILGDMNCGPDVAGTDIKAEFGNNFKKYLDAGLQAPYLAAAKPLCTWCAENPLVTDGNNHVIDHILLLAPWPGATVQTRRLFDAAASVDVKGKPLSVRLSDHYGAQVVVTPAVPPATCE